MSCEMPLNKCVEHYAHRQFQNILAALPTKNACRRRCCPTRRARTWATPSTNLFECIGGLSVRTGVISAYSELFEGGA